MRCLCRARLNNSGHITDGAKISSSGDVDVSVLSPSGSPRVSDDPVRSCSSIVGISSQLDAMVNLLSTCGKNSRVIELPRSSIDANGNGSSSGCLSVDSILSVQLSVRIDFSLVLVEIGSACSSDSISRCVGIFAVRIDSSSSLNVLVSMNGPSSVTSVRSGIAFNNLFHRQGMESMSSKSQIRFDGLSGRESPATSTLSLVVNSSNNSMIGPVVIDGISSGDSEVGVIDLGEFSLDGNIHFGPSSSVSSGSIEVISSEFFGSEIHELGNSKFSGSLVSNSQSLSGCNVLDENRVSIIELLFGGVSSSMIIGKLDE